MKKILLMIITILQMVFSKTIYSDTLYDEKFKVEQIVSNLDIPWGIEFIDENKLLISQKSGMVILLDLENKTIKNLNTQLNIKTSGQGGLLDVAVSPNYKNDKTIFFTYSKNIRGDGATTLVSYKLVGDKLLFNKEIVETKSTSDTTRHYGSRITFDKANHLYFSIGDRGVRNNAQNTNNHAGSILRLNLDGTIPKDNPFVDNENGLSEIYSFGHRNPQGIFYDKKRDILWSIEHGPRGGDEINIIKKALNYGWPEISYGKEYFSFLPVGDTHKDGMEQPFKTYIPSIAPSSLIVYSGKLFKKWEGLFFIGALKLQHINIVKLDENIKEIEEKRILNNLHERIRDITESPDGYIYFSTDLGNIYKISPKD